MLGEWELEDEGEMEEQEIRQPLSTAEEESEEGRERTTATMDALIERLLASGEQLASRVDVRFPLSLDEVHLLCRKVALLFASEPSLLEIQPPVSICGDVHGQFSDLLRIFRENGSPEGRQYLFLGDYVDRGSYSLETMCLLLAYKCRWPKRFYLLRGNHECWDVNRYHGFYEECRRRLDQRENCYVWRWFNALFNWMPLAATVGQRIFCTHGGLSPELDSVEQIRQLIRPIDQVPNEGLLTDLLWADPEPLIGDDDEQWQANVMRGISCTFGAGAVRRFCENNEIDVVVRAHQVVSQGYDIFNVGPDLNLVTVFSAPNYGQSLNYAAVMNVDVGLIVTFLQIDIFELRPDVTPPFDHDNDD